MEKTSRTNQWLAHFPWAMSFTECENCKSVVPISANLARELIKSMGDMMNFPEIIIEKEEDYRNYCFVVGCCMYCMNQLTEEEKLRKLKIEIKSSNPMLSSVFSHTRMSLKDEF